MAINWWQVKKQMNGYFFLAPYDERITYKKCFENFKNTETVTFTQLDTQ